MFIETVKVCTVCRNRYGDELPTAQFKSKLLKKYNVTKTVQPWRLVQNRETVQESVHGFQTVCRQCLKTVPETVHAYYREHNDNFLVTCTSKFAKTYGPGLGVTNKFVFLCSSVEQRARVALNLSYRSDTMHIYEGERSRFYRHGLGQAYKMGPSYVRIHHKYDSYPLYA